MTKEIRIGYGTGKDENGNDINFIEFRCPSCNRAIIKLKTTKKEKELMMFTCSECGQFQNFEKPATPESQNE